MHVQLNLSSSATLTSLNLTPAAIWLPQCCAIRLHVTAEDQAKDLQCHPVQLHCMVRGARSAHQCVTLQCALLHIENRLRFTVGRDRRVRAGLDGGDAPDCASPAEINRRDDEGGMKTNMTGLLLWWCTPIRKGEGQYDVFGAGTRDAIRIGMLMLKPQMVGLELGPLPDGSGQDAHEVGVTSASWSESLTMYPGAIFYLVLSQPRSKGT